MKANNFFKKYFFLLLTILFAFSLANAQSFVYLKNQSGQLVGTVLYNPSIVSELKIRTFCAYKLFIEGITCEALPASSPFASEPKKAVVLSNPKISPNDLKPIQDSLNDLTKKLEEFTKPSPQGQPISDNNNYPVGDAAIPRELEGSDKNTIAVSSKNETPFNSPTTPPIPVSAPQFNSPLPDVSALVNAAVARAIAGLNLQAPVVQPAPEPISPSKVISSFFSNIYPSSQYIGYGAGENNLPNNDANFKNLNLSGAISANDANFSGTLNAAFVAIASSTVNNVNATSAIIVSSTITSATATNLYSNVANISNASITNSSIGVLNVTNNYSISANASNTVTDSLLATYATISNATATNISVANISNNNLSSVNSTITNSTSTNLFSTILNAINTYITNLTVVNSTSTNSTSTNLSVSATTTSTGLSSVFASITAAIVNTLWGTTANFTTVNATTTNATTSNAVTFNGTTINTQNFYASTTYATTSLASTSYITNLNVAGSSTLGSTTISNLTVPGNIGVTNINAVNGTITNATVTNNYSQNISNTNIVSTGTFAFATGTIASTTIKNLNSTFASITEATTTNFFAAIFNSLATFITDLIATNATFTNATSTNLYVSGNFQAPGITGTNITASNATITNATVTNTLTLTVAPNGWLYTNSSGQIYASSSPTVSYITATTSTSTFLGVEVGGNIVPLVDNVLSLGSPSKRFKDLYVASSTIYIDNVGLSNNNGALTWAGSGIVALQGASTLGSTTITNATITDSIYVTPFVNLGGLVFATSSGRLAQTNALAFNQASNLLVLTGGLTAGATSSLNTLDMNSTKIVNLAAPTNTTDAVNKAYVDAAFASGVLWQAPVKSISTTTAPGGPTIGDRYIIMAGQSGFGTCVDDDIAEWAGGSWTCYTPATGTTVFVDSTINQQYNFNGTSWNSIAQSIDHATLYNLQGGTAGEYYHLNATQYNALNAGTAQLTALQTVGNPTFNSITLTTGLNVATISAATRIFSPLGYFTSLLATTTYATTSNATTFVGTTGNINTINAQSGNFTSVFATGTSQFTTFYASTTYATNTNVTNATITSATITNLSVGTLQSGLTNGYVYRGSSANLSEATSSLFIANNGSVGLGTTAPGSLLDLYKNASAGDLNTMTFSGLNSGSVQKSYASLTGTVELNSAGNEAGGLRFNVLGNGSTRKAAEYTGTPANSSDNWKFYTNNTARLMIDGSGNIGIGTTTPNSKLQVIGGNVEVGPSYGGGVAYDTGNRSLTVGAYTGTPLLSLQRHNLEQFNISVNASGNTDFGNAGGTRMSILSTSGNVGIGTTAPGNKLDVLESTANAAAGNFYNSSAAGAFSGGLHVANTNAAANVAGGIIRLTSANTTATNKFIVAVNSGGEVASIYGDGGAFFAGNVGIANSSPKTSLTVGTTSSAVAVPSAGSINGASAYFTNSDPNYGMLFGSIPSTGAGYIQQQRTDGTATTYNLLLNPNGGNVGIGTTAPNSLLEIRKDTSSALGASFSLNNQAGGAGSGSALDFLGAGSQNVHSRIQNSDDGAFSSNLLFYTKTTGASANAIAERMRITSSGNVGIGDTSPNSLLTVGSGDLFQVNSSGNIVKINNVTTSWPSAQGAASTVLTNDGSGNLSWAAGGSGITSLNGLTGSTQTFANDTNITISSAATTHTLGWSGQLSVARGGTGISSFGAGVATWLGTPSSANLISAITDETGSGSLVFGTSPTISSPTITGTTTSNNGFNITAGCFAVNGTCLSSGGGSGVSAMTAVGSSPNANGATISGSNLTLQPADATNPGVVTTGAQTFAGAKTFSGTASFSGTLSAKEFRLNTGAGIVSTCPGSILNVNVTGVSHVQINAPFGCQVSFTGGTTGQLVLLEYNGSGADMYWINNATNVRMQGGVTWVYYNGSSWQPMYTKTWDDPNSVFLGSWIYMYSDASLKDKIATMTSAIEMNKKLNAVTFDWNATGTQITGKTGHSLGFIAQDVQQAFPEYDLVSTTSSGYLAIDYPKLTAILSRAIQEIVEISGEFRDNLIAWLGNAQNGVVNIFSKKVYTDQLCVGQTCLNEDQIKEILQKTNTPLSNSVLDNSSSNNNSTTTSTTTDITSGGGDTSTSTESTSGTGEEGGTEGENNTPSEPTPSPDPEPSPSLVPEHTPEPTPTE